MWLARTCVLWLIGIAAADVLWPPTEAAPRAGGTALAALLVTAVGLALATHARRFRPSSPAESAVHALAVTGAVVLAGAGRTWLARPRIDAGHVARWRERGEVSVEGVVASEPERRDGGMHYVVAVTAVRGGRGAADTANRAAPASGAAAAAAHGRLLAQAARFPVLAYGDRVRVHGTVETPPVLPDFDYRTYLARKGIHAVVRRAHVERVGGRRGGWAAASGLIALKLRAQRVVARSLPEPEAALAVGILLGDDNGLPRAVAEAFRRTNTTHVIAISGANIALLVAALHVLLKRWRRRGRAAGVTIGVVAAYTLLVGADPAVVRAAVMGGLVVAALANDRRAEAVTALALAGAAMTAWRPAIIGDLGFQLSFAATAGLVAFAGRLGDWAATRRIVVLKESVLVTLAAQLATWPLVAWHTGQVGVLGLAANVLIVPVQPAVMATGGATIAAGLVAPGLGRLVGAVAWLPLAWTVRVVEAFAALPGAALAWRPPLAVVAGYYVVLTAAAMPDAARRLARTPPLNTLGVATSVRITEMSRWWRTSDVRERLAPRRPVGWPTFALAAAAAVLAWRAVLAQPDGLLHVVALDVGQGDAILVVTPNGRRMLVDGGPSPSAVLDGLGRRFAPWDRRLDVVVLTHPDADHVGGLPAVLDRYRVAQIVQPAGEHGTPDAAAWDAAVARETRRGAAAWVAARGMRLVLDEAGGVAAEVLWPRDGDAARAVGGDAATTNDRSIVLSLRHGARRIVLTGDIEAPVERALVRSGADVRGDVLKVAHHGSATSSTGAFVAAVGPWLAVISVGADNRFGHPDAGVLERLTGVTVRRTDADGAVDVITDGEGIWVR